METVTLVLSVLIIALRFFLAVAVYFSLRYLVAAASEWHMQCAGYKESKDGQKIWKNRPLPFAAQVALCLLAAAAVLLA